jgi:hypothetical protein
VCNSHVGGLADGSKLPPCVILNCNTLTVEQLPRGISQIPTQRLDNQHTCEELVLSGVEQKARGTPEKTGDAAFGCI